MSESPAAGQLTHGFLFADLRGYSAFVERNGDAAGADLLDRYRALVRDVIARTDGAEIRTEGDSFYVVFPSASRAVAAGLAIVEAAAAASVADPDRPIAVGVGIHAGEAEERPDGYVGSAVNVAARVCSVARPGEVLVTDMVRGLTRTSGRYRFAAQGRPALKGISEPIALFAATPADGTAVAAAPRSRTFPRAAGIGALAALAVLVAVAAVVAMSGGNAAPSHPSPTPAADRSAAAGSPPAPTSASPSASPGIMDFKWGRLAAGTYRLSTFDPPLRLTFPDGWYGAGLGSNIVLFQPIEYADSPSTLVIVFRPWVVYEPCARSFDQTHIIGRTTDALLAWLEGHPNLSMGAPAPIAGGLGVEFEVTFSKACPGSERSSLWLFRPAEDWNYVLAPGEKAVFNVMEVAGETVLVAVSSPGPGKVEEMAGRVRPILKSLAADQP